ncbi:MAG: SAM-dependent methyltransferase, partial [Mycobacteriaceae bacterium]
MSTLAVDLTGRPVLVVGTGAAAASAATALLRAGAVVHVLSDGDPGATVEDLADRGQLTVHTGPASAAQPLGHAVVAARTGDPAVDRTVEAAAAAAGVAVLPRGEFDTSLSRAGVTILGGGPGDPGLLTMAGYRVLAAADVVVADRLAPLAVLDDLPRRPLVIDAAKVPGGRSMPQEQINALLIEHALAGRAVVRLKGGDPFVFGRGMEEVQACTAAGVAVDVLPGVTSAISVPALAG